MISKWHRLLSGCVRTLMRNLRLQHAYTISRASSLFNKLRGVKKGEYRKEGSLVGLAIIRFCDLINTKL
jgi:hypothetical protein